MPGASLARADAAFQRALELSPDLPLAHNLYTALQVDTGRARAAMLRLLNRAEDRGADPELFRGTGARLPAIRAAGRVGGRARARAPARSAGDGQRRPFVPARFGRYEDALQRDVEVMPVPRSLALLELGRSADAFALLRTFEQRHDRRSSALEMATSLRALAEGNRAESLASLQAI